VATEIVITLPLSFPNPFLKPHTMRQSSSSTSREAAFVLCAEFFALFVVANTTGIGSSKAAKLLTRDLARLANVAYLAALHGHGASRKGNLGSSTAAPQAGIECDREERYVVDDDSYSDEDTLFDHPKNAKRPRLASSGKASANHTSGPRESEPGKPNLARFVPLSRVLDAVIKHQPLDSNVSEGIDTTGILVASGLIDCDILSHRIESKPLNESKIKLLNAALSACDKAEGALGIALRLRLTQLLRPSPKVITSDTTLSLFNAISSSFSSDYFNGDVESFPSLHQEVLDAAGGASVNSVPTNALQLFKFIHQKV